MASIDEIDLTDLDVFAERMPHDWFDLLRRDAPVWRHPANEEEPDGFWVVSSYEHISEAHRVGTLFSHQTGPGRNGAGGIALNDIAPGRGPGLQMVMTDPPQHTRYRKLVNTGFTPRMIRRMEEVMRLRTSIILDRICEQGSADFVVDVADELPLMVWMNILNQDFDLKIGMQSPELGTSKYLTGTTSRCVAKATWVAAPPNGVARTRMASRTSASRSPPTPPRTN